MKRILFSVVCISLIVVAGGCTGVNVTADDLVPKSIALSTSKQKFEGSVNVQAKVSVSDSGLYQVNMPNWVDSVKLRIALEKALAKNGLFSRIEQGNADYVLDVWVETVKSSLSVFGEGFMIDMTSVWRLTRVKDGKVLVYDFVNGHGAAHAVLYDAHGKSLEVATRETIQNGLLVLSDQSATHMSAMAIADSDQNTQTLEKTDTKKFNSVVSEKNIQSVKRDVKVNEDKNAQLIQTATAGDLLAIQKLIAEGTDVNTKRIDGVSALFIASQNGHTEIVKFLLEKGAEVDTKQTTTGATALIVASQKGHMEVVKFLLEKGADVNVKNKYGVTALIMSSIDGHKAIVKLLLDKGADVNAKETTNGGTALIMAAQGGHTEVVELLLQKGAEVNAKITTGTTALWMASQNGHTEVVKLLLDNGADVKAKDKDGITALWMAAHKGHTEIVKLLIEKSADINAKQTTTGATALYVASQSGHVEVVKLLLEKGADVNAKVTSNNAEWTALKIAKEMGHIDTVQLLEKAGAKESEMERQIEHQKSCFIIPELQPGSPSNKVYITNCEVKCVTSATGIGIRMRSVEGQAVCMFGLPWPCNIAETMVGNKAGGYLPASPENARTTYTIIGNWKIVGRDGEFECVIESDPNTPLIFILEKGEGFSYIDGKGKVTVAGKNPVMLPCEQAVTRDAPAGDDYTVQSACGLIAPIVVGYAWFHSDAKEVSGNLSLEFQMAGKKTKVVYSMSGVKQHVGPTLFVTDSNDSFYLTRDQQSLPFCECPNLKALSSDEKKTILESADPNVKRDLVWKAWCLSSCLRKDRAIALLKSPNEKERLDAIRTLQYIFGSDVDSALQAAQTDVSEKVAAAAKEAVLNRKQDISTNKALTPSLAPEQASVPDSTHITVGAFTVEVPTDWRSFSEAESSEFKRQYTAQSEEIYRQYSGTNDTAKTVEITAFWISGYDGTFIFCSFSVPPQSDLLALLKSQAADKAEWGVREGYIRKYLGLVSIDNEQFNGFYTKSIGKDGEVEVSAGLEHKKLKNTMVQLTLLCPKTWDEVKATDTLTALLKSVTFNK